MIIDFASEFSDLLAAWTGTRETAGADNAAGQYVPGASAPLEFMATPVQPLSMRELRQQEGGEFVGSTVKTYTAFPVLINDVLTYRGISYQVRQIDDREPFGGYLKVMLMKVQNDV